MAGLNPFLSRRMFPRRPSPILAPNQGIPSMGRSGGSQGYTAGLADILQSQGWPQGTPVGPDLNKKQKFLNLLGAILHGITGQGADYVPPYQRQTALSGLPGVAPDEMLGRGFDHTAPPISGFQGPQGDASTGPTSYGNSLGLGFGGRYMGGTQGAPAQPSSAGQFLGGFDNMQRPDDEANY